MEAAVKNQFQITDLRYLPGLATFILDGHLEDFVQQQSRLAGELNFPLLRFFEHLPKEKILEYARHSAAELLTSLAHNNATNHIDASLQRWFSNQLPVVNRGEIVAEDITLIHHLRKQTLVHFIPFYTSNVTDALELVKEIDRFVLASETALTNAYMQLLKNDIREQLYFNKKITDTSPGIIYVFDLVDQKEVYSNKKLEQLFGYDHQEMQQMGSSVIDRIIHPDDVHFLQDYIQGFSTAKDGETRSTEYRLRNNENQYRWLRTYETIFKRNEKGEPLEIIGIALDVTAEKETASQLQYREEQLLEAQDLAEIGSYEWDIIADNSKQTPQLEKILEQEKGRGIKNFLEHVHEEDRSRVQDALNKAFTDTGIYDCEFRYHINGKEKALWSRGRVVFNADRKPIKMNGTVMDVTERHRMVQKLQRSEEIYRQAEALTHIGNYTWDLSSKKMKWTDELYRIYDLEPVAEEIDEEDVMRFNHPDDEAHIQSQVTHAVENLSSFDFYYRITTAKKREKIVHARGEVLADPKTGKAYMMVGTLQDVTEKQTLIRNLKHNEQLYKQAQSLAHLGNWSWDIENNRIEWTDELYRIYGMQPQAGNIDFHRYLSFIHPDDLEKVSGTVQKCLETHQPYDYYHRILLPDGTIKTIHSKGEALLDKTGKPYKLVGTAQDATERQAMMQNLQKSESLYKQAQAMSHIGNWIYNFVDKKMAWSDELFRIYGLAPQSIDITSDDFVQLVHPDDRQRILQFLENCEKDPQPFELHHRNFRHDETVRILLVKGDVLVDDKKNVIGIFGTTQDVTEQQFIEEQLRENQTFIQKIADATPSIISSYNVSTGRYRFVSKGVQQLLGYEPELAMEQGVEFFVKLVHPDDLPSLEEKNNQALEQANALNDNNASVVEFKYRMKHRNGEYRWFHTFGTVFDRNAEGRVEHILNISIDITDRMEAEQKILEQEYFIRHIADASPTILYLFHVKSGSVLYINKEIDSVLGYIPEEIIAMGSRAVPELYHPGDATKMKDRLHEYNDPEHPKSLFQFECRMKHKNGEWRWLLVREIVFKRTLDGKISEVLGAALDITERREMEEKLFRQTIELQQSNKSLEEYAYVASHDLKEPLRKISTFGDRLFSTSHSTLDNEGQNFLEKIISSSKRMQQMINDLLSVSMITGNKEFEMFSLKNILDDVVQTLDYKIEENQAVIESDNLPEAYIVPSQFRQLFQNLLSNSLKFIRADVTPKITVTHKFLSAAEAKNHNLAKASRYLQINFKDNGIGFDKQFTEKIFTIFQRLHSRSEYEGTGIGLAICRRITENHGGTIIAKGEPNKGSIFTIIIPI